MPQQLNLYAPSLCQSQQPNALGALALLQGTLLAVALAAGAGLQWHTRQVQANTLRLTAQTDARRGGLQPSTNSSAEQQQRDQLQRLRDHEAAAQRLQALLANGSAGRREGFVDYLEALARQAQPSVWITGLTLQGSDDAIELRGRMTDPAVLPDYLRGLQAEPRFKGRTFAALQIRRGAANGMGGMDGMGTTSVDASDLAALTTAPADFSEFTLSSQPTRGNDHAASALPDPTPVPPQMPEKAGTGTSTASARTP